MTDPRTRRPLFIRGASNGTSTFWNGSRAASSIPEDAILTELGIPILGGFDEYLLTESHTSS